jgi:hypothetical protein
VKLILHDLFDDEIVARLRDGTLELAVNAADNRTGFRRLLPSRRFPGVLQRVRAACSVNLLSGTGDDFNSFSPLKPKKDATYATTRMNKGSAGDFDDATRHFCGVFKWPGTRMDKGL